MTCNQNKFTLIVLCIFVCVIEVKSILNVLILLSEDS
jgi:hypothetical protein